MKSSLVLSIFLLATQSADAKCAADFRVFSGVVTDKEGKPVAGAIVGVSWSEKDGPAGPAMAHEVLGRRVQEECASGREERS